MPAVISLGQQQLDVLVYLAGGTLATRQDIEEECGFPPERRQDRVGRLINSLRKSTLIEMAPGYGDTWRLTKAGEAAATLALALSE